LGTDVKAAGQKGKSGHGRTISLVIIVAAAAAALYALHESNIHPTTSDSSLDADVVHIAAAVGGRILELPVEENARVAKGDLLFQIDPYPYRLAVEQSGAELAVATSNAGVAADQTKSAQENHDLAARTLERLRPLAANGYVPQQQLDQAQVSERDTATKLVQAQE
jgi:multidrug efflux system membrane fusion protein